MLNPYLLLAYGVVLLVFGITLTAAFAGIRLSKRNVLIFLGLFLFSGSIQLALSLAFSEAVVRDLYPLIAHLPLIALLHVVYRKPLSTATAAAFTAYLFCQPAKWFGTFTFFLTNSYAVETVVHVLVMVFTGYVGLFHLTAYFSRIFNKDWRTVAIFGFVPTFYYFFDYITTVYTNLFHSQSRVILEFLSFFLAVIYTAFCCIYYEEYKQKSAAQQKEQIIRIAVEQQEKEMNAVRQTEKEVRLLRHDMRMFLSSLAVSIENGEVSTAQEMINAQITRIDGTKLEHFCGNEILNFVISDYAARCERESVAFNCAIELDSLAADEIMFASILSNALDNALNAQKALPADRRSIKLMLKKSGEKLLLSVKNPVSDRVIFSDGLPLSGKNGHGYGTQSIRYLTECLGGNCQFSVQDDTFILRVVL